MDTAVSDIQTRTVAALALSAYVITRPGACSAAVKGTREMLSYIHSTSSRVLGLERAEGIHNSPMTMMRSDAPPNFWEREYAETPARCKNITCFVFCEC
jgi:hypothetical protein